MLVVLETLDASASNPCKFKSGKQLQAGIYQAILISISDGGTSLVDHVNAADIVYLEFSKEFNKVSYEILLIKW